MFIDFVSEIEKDSQVLYAFIQDNISILSQIIISSFGFISKNKLIFDGYPRSINQAKNLDLLLDTSNQKIDFVFFLNVNKETIIKRIQKRKILEKYEV